MKRVSVCGLVRLPVADLGGPGPRAFRGNLGSPERAAGSGEVCQINL